MQMGNRTILKPRRDLVLLLLAFAGGGTDAVAILGFNVLTAAQTGNTILLAVAVARGQFAIGISAAISVLGYVAGVAIGEFFIVRHPGSLPGRSGIVSALIAELFLLACLLLFWLAAGSTPGHEMTGLLVALAAVAMGIQSAAVLRLHAGQTTTYITGMLTNFTTGMIRWLLPGKPSQPTRQNPGTPEKLSGSNKPWKYGLIWVIYAAGAVFSGLLFCHTGMLWALLLPMATIAAAIVLGSHRPSTGRKSGSRSK